MAAAAAPSATTVTCFEEMRRQRSLNGHSFEEMRRHRSLTRPHFEKTQNCTLFRTFSQSVDASKCGGSVAATTVAARRAAISACDSELHLRRPHADEDVPREVAYVNLTSHVVFNKELNSLECSRPQLWQDCQSWGQTFVKLFSSPR